jgi:hypothetical protein
LKINSVNVLADQKFVEKVKRERIIFIRNYVKQQSKYFNNFDHDFSLTKTNALNVLLDYQINQMNDFDLQYV